MEKGVCRWTRGPAFDLLASMGMAQTLLYNAGVLTMDGPGTLFTNGAVLVEDKVILAVGRNADVIAQADPAAEKIDLRDAGFCRG